MTTIDELEQLHREVATCIARLSSEVAALSMSTSNLALLIALTLHCNAVLRITLERSGQNKEFIDELLERLRHLDVIQGSEHAEHSTTTH